MEKINKESLSPDLLWEKDHHYSGRCYFLDKNRAKKFAKRVGGKVRSFYLMIREGDPGDCWIVTWRKFT